MRRPAEIDFNVSPAATFYMCKMVLFAEICWYQNQHITKNNIKLNKAS